MIAQIIVIIHWSIGVKANYSLSDFFVDRTKKYENCFGKKEENMSMFVNWKKYYSVKIHKYINDKIL